MIEPQDGKTYWVSINGGKPFLADYVVKNRDRDGRPSGPCWWGYKTTMEIATTGEYILAVIRELFEPTDQILDETVESVRADLLARSRLGIAKYGVTLDRADLSLRDWLQHAYEETLDQANYLKRAIIELDKKP